MLGSGSYHCRVHQSICRKEEIQPHELKTLQLSEPRGLKEKSPQLHTKMIQWAIKDTNVMHWSWAKMAQ